MLRNARAALTAVALAILFLCGSPEPSRAAPAEPRFEPTPCPFTPAESGGALVECGQLVVPENRTAPESRLLRLAVTILRASGPEAKRDPIVYLSGGPGSAESSAVSRWLDHPLRGSRDFVLFDQRGTGRSGALCPELFRGVMGILARDLDLEAEGAAHRALAPPKSGGCVNLSPRDAKWLFEWTDPPVPETWHGVRSGDERGLGTRVRVR